jgi:phosphate transport system protein
MSIHLQRDIDTLKKKLLNLSALVEEAVFDALRALQHKDDELARKLIGNDDAIDELEVEVEEDCLKILALHQPVANDLRYVVAVMKINNDLERIGDLAVNIAQRALELKEHSVVPFNFDFNEMGGKVLDMLRRSLDALINLNPQHAREICAEDDKIDDMHRRVFSVVNEMIISSPQHAPVYIQYLSVSRYLERIADSATNIAEDVVYLAWGRIARHRPERLLNEK